MSENQAHVQRAVRKASTRLLPFLCLAYGVNFLDRINVSFAALAMNADLGFTASVFGFGAGIFFAGYILFEVPSNLVLARVGARLWIARIMISWGVLAVAMSLVTGPWSFYVTRFLLGVAEAGFFPGIILYLTTWFPARERARIVSLFMAALPVATVIGAPVSGALLGLHGLWGLKGWQWLFIVEGVPAVLLGIAAWWVLDERPEKAKWLTKTEARALAGVLAAEAEETEAAGYATLRQGLTNRRVLSLGILYFCIVIGLYGIGFWMPQVLQGYGLTPLQIGLLVAIPYLFASGDMVLWGWHSDRTGERRWHVALPLLVAGAALAVSAMNLALAPMVLALTVATVGIYAAVGTSWSFSTSILTGAAAAAGIALINSIGNAGGLVGPYVVGVLKDATGGFTAALLFLAGALVIAGIAALVFGHNDARIVPVTPRGRPATRPPRRAGSRAPH
jgi:ACS family tartrate transporter-like MFS transporter